MLKRDRDMRQYGVARDQRMADATLARRNNTNAHVKHGEERVLCLEEGVAGLTIGLGQEEIMAGVFMTTIQEIRIITEEEISLHILSFGSRISLHILASLLLSMEKFRTDQ